MFAFSIGTVAISSENDVINAEREDTRIVIKEVDQRHSLLTPDKTVTVTYIDAEPPLLHTDQDVPHFSSHQGTDDESSHYQRDSLFTPGFENLDCHNFEHFGENVRELESQREEADQQWEAGRKTNMRNSGVVDTPLREKLQEQEGLAKKLNFEDKKACLPENIVEQDMNALLSRWEKQNSLNKIDQLSIEEKKHTSVMPMVEPDSEEDDDDDSIEETVSVESLHIRHLDARGVYLKMQDFESQREERGYTQVLQMRDHIQKHDDHQDRSGKVKRKRRPSSGVQAGNVNAKLEMFGGGMNLKQVQLKRRDKTRHHPGSPIKTNLFKDEFTFDSISTSSTKVDSPTTTTVNESPKDEVDTPTDGSPSHGKVKRRSSLSSRASVTTFETIREVEEDNEGENNANLVSKHSVAELEGDESEEDVAPLPKLQPNLSRRLSQERLRLDGLLSTQSSDVNFASKDESPQRDSHSRKAHHNIPSPAVGQAQKQLHVSFHSIDQKESTSVPQFKHKGRSRSRPVSAPPFHQKAVTNLEQAQLADEVLKAESKVAALLSPPVAAGSNLQLDIVLNRGSMKIWKQEV